MSSSPWLPPQPAFEPAPPPSTAPEPPREPAGDPQPAYRRLLGPLLVLGAFVLKFGKAAVLLLPKAKVLTTSGSMLVSVAAYSLIWTWKFALGFVLLLLVHEMGHVLQLRREGIKATAPLFIPFLGAVVGMKQLPDDAAAEARVGLAGPVLGTAGAIAVWGVAEATGSDLLRALAYIGFFLNLLNLAPVLPLDGGRAMAAMAPWLWYVGFAVIVVLVFVAPNPVLILVLLLGGYETYRRFKQRRAGGEETRRYYSVRPATRLAIGAVYVALIVVTAIGVNATYVERTLDSV